MLTAILSQLYERDLNKLREEIEQFTDEADLWKTSGGITNSAGNLCRHLTGNLQHFFGAVLGGSGYVRDRDAEFAAAGGREIAVRGRRRMQRAREHVAEARRAHAQLERVHEAEGGLEGVLREFDGKKRPGMRRAQDAAHQRLCFGRGVESRIMRAGDARMLREARGDLARVGALAVEPQGQRL